MGRPWMASSQFSLPIINSEITYFANHKVTSLQRFQINGSSVTQTRHSAEGCKTLSPPMSGSSFLPMAGWNEQEGENDLQ